MIQNQADAVASDQVVARTVVPDSAWQEHRRLLYAFVLRRVHDRAAADDVVQEIMLKAYQQRHTLSDSTRLRPWLYQIARNTIVDHHRARRRNEPLVQEFERPAPELVDAAERELAHCLVPMLSQLPAPYRVALALAEFDERPIGEVAMRLGLSVSGAKSRVQRGRRMLRDLFLKCCDIQFDPRGAVRDYELRSGCSRCETRSSLTRACA